MNNCTCSIEIVYISMLTIHVLVLYRRIVKELKTMLKNRKYVHPHTHTLGKKKETLLELPDRFETVHFFNKECFIIPENVCKTKGKTL